MSLSAINREFNPFTTGQCYVLCEKLIADGHELKFGDAYPQFHHLAVFHTHFNNGVVGTKEELDKLGDSPIELYAENDCVMPMAMFVTDPYKAEKIIVEKAEKKKEEEERDPFYIENCKLIPFKKDIVAYAAEYGIRVKNTKADTKDSLIARVEKEAKKLGLLG